MYKIILLTLVLSFSALADLKIGVYEGNQKGTDKTCLIAVKEVKFKDDVKHPLMERVIVLASQSLNDFTLAHLPKIDLENKKISPESGVLTGVNVDDQASEALKLIMVHSAAFSGPTTYHYVRNSKSAELTHIECVNLKFID